MTVLAFALAFAGFLALCLAMFKHHRDVFGRPPAPWHTRLLRGAGFALVALAGWPCVGAWGAATGTVVWLGVLSIAGLAVVAAITAWPGRATRR